MNTPPLHEIAHGDIERGGSVILHAGIVNMPRCGVVGLVGINGAGKTTFMLAIADLLRRSVIASARMESRFTTLNPDGCVGYSPQRPSFPAWLTGLEVARMFGVEYDNMVAAQPSLLLGELREIRGDRLSAGQSQALSVALALYRDDGIALLDEPFAPLDFRRRVALSEQLRDRRYAANCDRLTIVSTQSATELIDVCDWLIVLRAGHYALSAPMHEVMHGALDENHARKMVERRVLEILA